MRICMTCSARSILYIMLYTVVNITIPSMNPCLLASRDWPLMLMFALFQYADLFFNVTKTSYMANNYKNWWLAIV